MILNLSRTATLPLDREIIRRVREVLDRAGFHEQAVLHLLDIPCFPGLTERRRLLPTFLERTSDGGALNTIVRLFVLHQPVDAAEATAALAPMELADWKAIGLTDLGESDVSAAVELCLCGNVIAAADWPGEAGKNIDEVMSLAPSSRALAQMTIRRPVETAFDLGTGCGVQAILASRHSRQVSAADINPRAVEFAKFNACLNNADNISFSVGSLFEPVQGQTFDLIICNPPFVIGPKLLYTHTSSGTGSDTFSKNIVRNAPERLTEGGFAQVICNWAHIGDETSEEHLESWFQENACDAWVLRSHTVDAAGYARSRAEENSSDASSANRLYDQWMKYFELENITAVSFGIITLRRSSRDANWSRFDDIPGVSGPCGRSIELGFCLWDFLEANRDDRVLLNAHVRSAPNLKFGTTDGNGKVRMRLETGLTFSANLDTEIADFISRCNGDLTLGDHARKIAADKHLSMQRVVPPFLSAVRKLIERGFLLPVELLSLDLDKLV